MQKSAGRIFKLLFNKRLNKLIILSGLIILVSIVLFLASFEKPQKDSSKLAFGLNAQCRNDVSGRCFSNFFTSFAKDHPLADSRNLLQRLQELNPKLGYCHSIAHGISIAEVEKNPAQWLEIFKEVPDSECSYGYFHGVIEGKYRSDPEFKVDNRLIDKVCLKMESEGAHRSCAHAFGHVLLVQETGDFKNALKICDRLGTGIKSPCFQGVFMENVQRENLVFHGVSTKELWNEEYLNKQQELCNQFSEDKLVECWRSLGSVMLSVFNKDLNLAISACHKGPDYSSRRSCSREVLGQNVIKELAADTSKVISDDCSVFFNQKKEYSECVKDLVGYVLLTSKSYRSQITTFCKNTRGEVVQECLEVVRDYSK